MLRFQLLFCLLFSLPLSAQVTPERFFYEFNPELPPVVNVEVINSYPNRTVRVDVESTRVLNPGIKPENETTEGALIVSPKSFSLKPNGKRTVRLLLKNKAKEKEDVYRVDFLPKTYSDPDEPEKQGINIAVLIGAGTLIFAPPAGAVSEISWQKQGNDLKLINTGQKNLDLHFDKVCDSKGKNCREEQASKRLYGSQETILKNASIVELTRSPVWGSDQKLKIESDEGKYQFPF